MMWKLFFFYFLLLVQYNYTLKIGGLFDEINDDNYNVFHYAIEAINTAQGSNEGFELEPVAVKVPYGDEFQTSKSLCSILESGVAGVFGPTSPDTSHFVQSICDEKEIPLMQSLYDSRVELPIVNLYPHPDSLAQAILDLLQAFEWTSFTILYESAQWLPRVSNLLKMYDSKGYTITVRQIRSQPNENYRQVFKRVKASSDKRILIDCSIEALPEVLKQAQQVGLLTDEHKFIITNLDLHTIDLEPYQHGGTNITGIRLIDPNDPFVIMTAESFAARYKESVGVEGENGENEDDQKNGDDDKKDNSEEKEKDEDEDENENEEEKDEDEGEEEEENEIEIPEGLTAEKLRTSTALLYDAVLVFAEALRQLDGVVTLEPEPMSCDDTETFRSGYSITNFMRTSMITGLSKYIKFDSSGYRTDFNIDIIELTSTGIQKIGTWNTTHSLNIERAPQKSDMIIDDASMKNVSLRVLTAISAPYGMLKEASETLNGNDRFEGFGIELIERLAEILGFNYTFILQEDGAYGNPHPITKKWNGMIGELLTNNADLAVTDLTITSEREGAVDFTMPFMNLGISILYRRPTKQPPAFFSFMQPFSNEVWLCLGGAYLGVSICLFILGRISPYEWDNPYPCIEEPEMLENQFSFSNAMWFTIGALLQQGTELAPKTPSTRTIASIWWFFTLIMVSSYTAKLAAFLTVESISSPISSAKDLANANGAIMYGAKQGGSTINFFKDSDDPIHQKMYEYMTEHRELLTSSNEEGLKRVKETNYAFLMESTSIEYMTERECEVDQVNGNLDDKGYGIAMRKNFKYRGPLSEAVLKLQEQGKLTEMKTKWWKEKRGGGACSDTSIDGGGAVPLEFANVLGIFSLLIAGGVFAVFMNLVSFVFEIMRSAKEYKSASSAESAEELDMGNVGGVFLVLLVGSLISSLLGCCQWFYNIFSRSRYYKTSFKEEFIEEFKFVVKCHGNTKTVRARKSASTDSRQSALSGDSLQSRNNSPILDKKPDAYGFKVNGKSGKHRGEEP